MQAMMPSYLEASMENFRQNQAKIREAFEKGLTTGPLAAIHETNMAMMRAATGAFMPGTKPAGEKTVRRNDNAGASSKDEIAALREQMAAMQKKLDELGK
jgi:polyhydroxyalkanoate synthesis regulator protein